MTISRNWDLIKCHYKRLKESRDKKNLGKKLIFYFFSNVITWFLAWISVLLFIMFFFLLFALLLFRHIIA
jgi:Flp pilus assembly protein TadB